MVDENAKYFRQMKISLSAISAFDIILCSIVFLLIPEKTFSEFTFYLLNQQKCLHKFPLSYLRKNCFRQMEKETRRVDWRTAHSHVARLKKIANFKIVPSTNLHILNKKARRKMFTLTWQNHHFCLKPCLWHPRKKSFRA